MKSSAAWIVVAALVLLGSSSTPASANPSAVGDTFHVARNAPATRLDVLANDPVGTPGSRLSILAVTQPAHGHVSILPGGLAVSYTPNAGYSGPDSFSYTTSDVFQVVNVPRETLATVTGTPIYDGFGSACTPVPGTSDEYYVMTDRGPNVDGPAGGKVFALTGFTPQIGRYRLVDGALVAVGSPILLRDAAGHPRSGLPPPPGGGATGEVPYDNDGHVLAPDPSGLDSEGLVALPDGTFWVSDEYGPFVIHFAADGTTLEQITPFAANALGHKLPAVLGRRLFNKGMEGLTVTLDGKTLIGLMQDSLVNTSSTTGPVLRIVTYDLVTDASHLTGRTRQYLYLLDDRKFGCSEIAAVADAVDPLGFRLLADERDGKFPGFAADPSVQKRVYSFSLSGATDVSDPADSAGGKIVSGKTIEDLTAGKTASAATTLLVTGGVTPVTKTLVIDLLAQADAIGLLGTLYPHDKVEGLVAIDGGRRLVISNDDDFGVTAGPAPFSVVPKTIPTLPGTPADFTQLLFVDLANLPAHTATAVVSLTVGPRDVLGDALAGLEAYGATVDDPHADGTLDRAMEHLDKALHPDPFADELHLAGDGVTFWNELKHAVKDLLDALHDPQGGVDASEVGPLVDELVAQARDVAAAAVAESTAKAKEAAKAADALADGDAEAAAGDAAQAIERYFDAWKTAPR